MQTIEILGQEFRLVRLQGQGDTQFVQDPCWKCGGSGYLPYYASIFNGQCFACRGTGGTYRTTKEQERVMKRRESQRRSAARKADRKAAEKVAKLAAFAEAEPELAFMTTSAIFDDEVEIHPILCDMGTRLQQYGSISEKQIAFAKKLLVEQQERRNLREAEKAAAQPAPAGRQVVEGEVVMVRDYESDYGTTWKMMVKADGGFKVFVTVPRDLEPDSYTGGDLDTPTSFVAQVNALKGQRVRFTATLEPKADDPTFAIGKRPAKAQVLQD
jgi:hypothetical protein